MRIHQYRSYLILSNAIFQHATQKWIPRAIVGPMHDFKERLHRVDLGNYRFDDNGEAEIFAKLASKSWINWQLDEIPYQYTDAWEN